MDTFSGTIEALESMVGAKIRLIEDDPYEDGDRLQIFKFWFAPKPEGIQEGWEGVLTVYAVLTDETFAVEWAWTFQDTRSIDHYHGTTETLTEAALKLAGWY